MIRKTIVALLWLPSYNLAAQTSDEAVYQLAIEQARSGQTELALQQLRTLATEHPDRKKYIYDYMQVLLWAERNDEVLREAENLDLETAPAYALETVAKAARNKGQWDKAFALYTQAAELTPDRLTPKLGMGLVLLDQHKAEEASRYFDALAKTTQDEEVLTAQARAHDMAGHTQSASRLYRQILLNDADNPKAIHGLIRNLTAAGRLGQALTIVKQHRHSVSDEQWAELNWQYAAGLIRQGESALQKDPANFREIDLAIAAIRANLRALSGLNIRDKRVWQTRATADLLLAQHDRQRYADVDAEFQAAQSQLLDLPTYSLLAVADSYLKNQQPETARRVLSDIIAADPGNLSALIGLIRIDLAAGQTQDIAPTLTKIQTLAEQNPDRPRYRYDFLEVLSWLGRDEEVLQHAQTIDWEAAPLYVLETVARSARNRQDYPLAEKLYSLAADKNPDRLSPKLALAGLMLDQKHYSAALIYLQQLRDSHPTSIEVILAHANALNDSKQPLKAAELFRQALAIQPARADALRGLVFALANAEDSEQALRIADQNRSLFSDDEWAGLKWQQAAFLIRRGEQALYHDARDYRTIEQAIIEVQNNIALTEQLQLRNPDQWRQRAQFDLLVALRDRRRISDAIALYQQLQQQQIALPVYARMAAADAYLHNRQPEPARDLYLGVIQEVPDYFNAKASLAYAYLEAEQPDLALTTAEQLANEQPATISSRQTDGGEISIPNPQKAAAEMTAAIFHAYVDDLQVAQSRLERLHREYPDNTDIHSKLAEVYYFRGWPRRAQREITAARQQAPEHFGLNLNQARVAHELRDYPQEAALTYQLYTDYPEDSGAKKQMQAWRRHNKPELKVFANGGISSNQVNSNDTNPLLGNNNTAIDGYLYSNPIGKNFRVFTHEGWRTGLFKASEGGRGYLRTYGAGLEYAKDEALATAEIHYDNFRSDAVGVDLGLDYQLNDQWQLFTRLSSLDNTISLRALSAKDEIVKAKSAKLGATFRVNESRFFRASAGYTHFSNNNDRVVLDSTYYERWYSGPIYKFGTYLNVAYSTNSRPNQGFYFNPKQDAIASITLDNDWLTYRHYETDFHQRLALTLGGYWQEDFGTNPVGNIEYQHRWRLGPDVELSYGGARVYRYYDNALTESWQGYLTADIRF
ncbi:poly-beta-1,6 N-acetyl-D-glucosamine export porin PgaA [Methylomonas methanica]|uniref:Tetratricopeptide TPR_2 repeat-containing protein n=1 Tax=Methylomonas methanica (strain DSM 25384 / MC09) TaxID=857087 RepID=G0A377_METMM|nr:poly-beta-1,6 N-acetyl-D-glucosamine export porin PgaA [Methylomonas methanica]AEF99009.1 Tetratricopeptide TPR_2 repeat-containing protein [Methylomonas methanica MC09]